jgi:hypothetical protein
MESDRRRGFVAQLNMLASEMQTAEHISVNIYAGARRGEK